MNVQARILICTLAGVAAGLLTWFVTDLSGLMHIPDAVRELSAGEWQQQQIVGMVFGALIGALLGVADRLASGTTTQIGKAVGVGLAVGFAAGFVGLVFGAALFGGLYVLNARNPLAFVGNVLARALGWAFIGALAGTADGWRKWSFRVGRNGFIGGLLGGLIGGTTFEIVPYLVPGLARPGVLSRLAGFTITGAMIGLFVALVQQLLKEAWIRVVVGRNEGREYLVEKAQTTIGRSELSDVPLFGDTAVERTHVVVAARSDGRFVLRDNNTKAGTLLNDERVGGDGEVVLRDGDRIGIAGRTLIFRERLTRRRTARAPKDVAAAPPRPASGLPSLGDSLPPLRPAAAAPQNGNGFAPAPALDQSTRLVAVAGPHAGAAYSIGPAGANIGRDPDAAIPLPGDTKASRLHARIVREGANIVIEDAGSTNGTYVNGQKVSRQTLAPGDTVLIGSTALRVE